MRSSHPSSGRFGIFLAGILAAGLLAMVSLTSQIGSAVVPIWFFLSVMAVAISFSPLGKAMAARVRDGTGLGGESLPLGEGESNGLLNSVYAEIDQLQERIAELEERQDFTERILASRNQSGDLPIGQGKK